MISSSRRDFLACAASTAAVGMVTTALPAMATATAPPTQDAIASLFKPLPGEVSFKIYAPAVNGKPEFLVASNSAKAMFCGSAFKSFVLCEILRQADSPDIARTLNTQQLTLDASVWSLNSSVLNPPNLIGKISLRTALEAMIAHSDNTATDMCLNYVGPAKVRALISSIGLKSAVIPNSTRTFFGYLLGAKDYQTFSWEQLGAATNAVMANKPLNPVETMACSADDFVTYYSRALAGEFFKNAQTLSQFRRVLSMGDAVWGMPMPLGATCFLKGGTIDVPGFHAVCAPGGMLFDDRWVYFCLTINWTAASETDPTTVQAFAAAASRAMTMVKDGLAC